MAHDSLAFRFAVVLALAVIILVVMTLAALRPLQTDLLRFLGKQSGIASPNVDQGTTRLVIAARKAASTRLAASSCMPGMT